MSTPISIELARKLLPDRPAEAHKGTFGHLFVIAGSRGFTGAAQMMCLAAARTGAGLVTAGIPRAVADVVAGSMMEIMTFPLPSTDQETFSVAAVDPAIAFAENKDAIAVGPGLSQHPHARDFALQVIERCTKPMLIDADGLNALATNPDSLSRRTAPTVLTPHPGEMSRLSGLSTNEIQGAREQIAAEYAEKWKVTLVLKGAGTVVASPGGDVFVNTTGNSGMGTGGTGDVLSGMIGSLMAQGMDPTDAAILGVYAHGMAGDFAARDLTERAMIAGDVIDRLPEAWAALEAKA